MRSLNYNTIPVKLSTDTEQLVFTAAADVIILGFQVANIHSTNLTEFDAYIRRESVDFHIVKGFNVSPGVSRNPIDEKAKIILVDGDQLYVKVNADSEADVIVSYVVLSGDGSSGLLPVQEGDAGKIMVVKNTENGYKLASIQDVFLTISPADAGKVVIVNETGTGYEVEAIVLPQGLPDIEVGDEGKFLRVEDGEAKWVYTSVEIPTASASVLGGIKVGSGLSISDGVLSADVPEIPEATTESIGGVIVGSGLEVFEGTISAVPYALPAASGGTRGGIRLGHNVSVREGTIDMIDVSFPVASDEVLGGIKVGEGLSIEDGVLSVDGGGGGGGEPPSSMPSGSITAFAGASAPSGWLICNGAEVSRSTYSNLFAVVGTTYGAGDGSTTFKLPDLRGEFIRGLDNGRGVDAGRVLGTAQSSSNLQHNHSGTAASDGSHSHTGSSGAAGTHSHTGGSSGAGSHSHTGSAASAGSHQHSVIVVRDINSGTYGPSYGWGTTTQSFPVQSGGEHSHTLSIGSDGHHSHSMSLNDAGSHSHTVSVASGGAHTHNVSTNNSGGTEARPRNIALNYIIKV